MKVLKKWCVLLLFFSSGVMAQNFKIIGIEGAPLRYFDETNTLVGIDVDIIDTVMGRLNLPYEIEMVSSSTRLEHLWHDPNTDMILTYSYKDQRAKHLTYPSESHVTLSWNFFILKSRRGEFNYQSLNDLQGLRVGATHGFSYTNEFWEAADAGVFTLDMVVKNELNMNKLLRGRFDTYANSRIDTLYQAKQGGFLDKISFLKKPLKEKKYFNTFVKVSDYPDLENIIKKYDIELGKMRQNGELEAIFEKYLGKDETYN